MGRKRVNLYLVNLSQDRFQSNYSYIKLDRFAQINFALRFSSNKVKVTLLQKLLSNYVQDLIADWGHFKDHRRHFKLAMRSDKQRTIPSCIKFSLSELKEASIRLQNYKFSWKKHTA